MMTKTVVAVQPSQNHEDEAGAVAAIDVPSSRDVDELEVAASWCARPASRRWVNRPGGLLKAMTKTVIEIALDEELSEHLGYDRHDRLGMAVATRATEPARKRCSLMGAVPLRSMSHGIGRHIRAEDRRKTPA
ncbi:transposase, Mutator family protein [Mycobacterium ulcerans str. Harvey]|uniref:Transposase, Mutator family protein n=1 Tax=Mycobacterium ulcerans str. Harvey TaxID=1299332 RepID=A0ABN0RA73_MYCUL|nr:transposase, Mutator family protein [Mycobacterium ulcerans str. Harvey]